MRIQLASVVVDDQEKALRFYTEKLGFVKKLDIPMGGEHRWLTVTGPDNPNIELLLEPMGFEPARVYQKALKDAGIPATMFFVDDIQAEYDRLQAAGVSFRSGPAAAGPATIAVLDDTVGNWIQIVQI